MAFPLIKVQFFLYLALIKCLIIIQTTTAASEFPMSLPGCPDKCGDITIPYPFGTCPGCHRDGFYITCDNSTNPPKPIWGKNIPLLGINITSAEVQVLNLIGYDCYYTNEMEKNHVNYRSPMIEIKKPFLFSNIRNMFTVIGCYTFAYIYGERGDISYTSGCASFCEGLNTTSDGGPCDGLGCCQTTIPKGLNYYQVTWGYKRNKAWSFSPCSYAMLVQEDWYNFTVEDLKGFGFYERNKNYVPVVLDWAIRETGTCLDNVESSSKPACLSKHSGCNNTVNGDGYFCKCLTGYEGNPYLPDGCTDINECEFEEVCKHGTCINTNGSYECDCPIGRKLDRKTGHCVEKFAYVVTSCILGIAILLGLCFLLVWYLQHKKHMKEKKEYNSYYHVMKNHLRVFSEKEIENATQNYSDDFVLGRGGQGNVYKGFLENNQIVAIKKAKEVQETQRKEFLNEIILLAQINHKNVVRLLGCCFEVKIPTLVSEFVPNGTFFYLLHRKGNLISLDTRLKIALDSAVALDYLHDYIACSIIHGDVKSANILLDADYTAKVSDFGASSVVPVNEIVKLVHFSHGYLDPECLFTYQITKKSDVYSFGVVMLELLTRKKAIYIDEKGEKLALVESFLWKASKNEHREILDGELVTNDENVMVVLEGICEIALQCLNPKGEDRPTMKLVVEELKKLVTLHNSLPGREIVQEKMEILSEIKFPSTSIAFGFNSPHPQYRYSKSALEIRVEVD